MDIQHGLFDLSGKKALVTGCSRGIGYAIAVGLAEAGADIIGVSHSLSPGSDVENEIISVGRNFYNYAVDLGDRNALYQFISAIKKEHEKVDILINNAGTILRKPAAEHPDSYWDVVMKVNLDAAFILTREIGKDMIARKNGKIIFTCSLLSFQGGIMVPGYAASKGALASLIKAFANEWAKEGVNVNGIAPGYIDTDNTEPLRNDPARSKSILDRIPAGRWGEPGDFKGIAVFLSSRSSDYVNGSIIPVDGGWLGR